MLKEFLFELIKSLDAGERAYFLKRSKVTRTNESPKYVELFHAINAMEKYDESALVEKLAHRKVLNLPEAKQFLYATIMRRLRQYHSQKNGHIKLQEYRTDLSLLMEKGLWHQAQKTIQKAKRIAHHGGLKLYDLEFAMLERRIAWQLPQNNAAVMVESQAKCASLMKQLDTELEILNLHEQAFLNAKSDYVIRKEIQYLPDRMKAILGDDHRPYLQHASFDSKTHYYSLFGIYFRLKKKYEASKINLEKLLAVFEETAGALNEIEYQERYLNALNNYFNLCFEYGIIHESYHDIMERVQKIAVFNYNLEVRKFYIENYFKILYYFSNDYYEEVIKIAPYVKKQLLYYGGDVIQSRRITFVYYIATAYFMSGNSKIALTELNHIVKDKEFEARKDIQLLARMLRILIFFANGDYALLRHASTAFNKYAKRQNKNDSMEAEVVRCINDAVKLDMKAQRTMLRAFYQEKVQQPGYREVCIWLNRYIL